jgi:hypothetical protein
MKLFAKRNFVKYNLGSHDSRIFAKIVKMQKLFVFLRESEKHVYYLLVMFDSTRIQ